MNQIETGSVLNNNALAVIEGSLEIIGQGEALLCSISDEQYCFRPSSHMTSTIGEHIRHIIDLFISVREASTSNLIDYDIRNRGASVETARGEALALFSHLKEWVGSISADSLTKSVKIKSEVSLSVCRSVEFDSTYSRELAFAGMHMVHHIALIRVLASLQGIVVDKNFGLAPATATFRREEA